MRREVVPAVLPGKETRLRLLVVQVQALVTRIEVHQRGFVNLAAADALEKIQRIADRVHDALIGVLQRRLVHEPQIPVLRMVQIREPALDQRAHEVQGQRGALVAAQQQLGVRRTRLGGEFRTIDQVSAIARQRDPAARLGVRRAGLGVLTGHAPDADDGFLQSVQQHETHLQQDLELLGDGVRFAIGKRFRTVTALQQKRLPALGGGEAPAQRLDLPGDHDRRQPRDVRHNPLECARIRIHRLLLGRPRLPAGAVPGAAFG